VPPHEAVAWEETDNDWRCCGLQNVLIAGWARFGDGTAAQPGRAIEPRAPQFCFMPSDFSVQPGALDIIRMPSGGLQHSAAQIRIRWYTNVRQRYVASYVKHVATNRMTRIAVASL
jgi:hypothetical protein